MTATCAIAVALDIDLPDEAFAAALPLASGADYLKVGPPLALRGGQPFLDRLAALGPRLFIDLKFHDIPSTVGRSIEALAPLPVSLLTVHASGGVRMLEAAAEAAGKAPFPEPPRVLAVTVLTSLDAAALAQTGVVRRPLEQVVSLALLAMHAGCAGIVCSPFEAAEVRRACGPGFFIVTPGIRPEGSSVGDQARFATPRQAAFAGADCLVIGRPLYGAPDPAAALRAVRESLAIES
jgi:orotidine-5'-phosphate decarboxylase